MLAGDAHRTHESRAYVATLPVYDVAEKAAEHVDSTLLPAIAPLRSVFVKRSKRNPS